MSTTEKPTKPNRDLAIITKILERVMDKITNIEKDMSDVKDNTTKLETEVKTIIKSGDRLKESHVKWLQKVVWTIIGAVISGVGYVGMKYLEHGGK